MRGVVRASSVQSAGWSTREMEEEEEDAEGKQKRQYIPQSSRRTVNLNLKVPPHDAQLPSFYTHHQTTVSLQRPRLNRD